VISVGRLVVLQLIAGAIGGLIAAKKGRNALFWTLACFLFPLLIIIISFLPSRHPETPMKRCPQCLRRLDSDEDACRDCSGKKPIELVQCRACGSFVPEDTACPECGKKI